MNIRQLRIRLGTFVKRVAYQDRSYIVTDHGADAALLLPMSLLPRTGLTVPKGTISIIDVDGVPIDAAQSVLARTVKTAEKLAGKLGKNSKKKAGKRVYPAPKAPPVAGDVSKDVT